MQVIDEIDKAVRGYIKEHALDAAVKALMLRYVFDEPAEGIEPIQALRRATKTAKETRLRAALPLIAVRWKEGLFD